MNPARLSAAKDVKFRIYHGDADNIVPVEGSRQAYKALKAAGADVEYIEFPESIMAAGHRRSMILSLWVGCLIRRKMMRILSVIGALFLGGAFYFLHHFW